MEIKRIQGMMRHNDVEIEHVFREGNHVVDFFTDINFNFVGREEIHFNLFQKLSTKSNH